MTIPIYDDSAKLKLYNLCKTLPSEQVAAILDDFIIQYNEMARHAMELEGTVEVLKRIILAKENKENGK